MQWEERNQAGADAIIADMVDVSFRIRGRILAVDHHHALAAAITQILPWFRQEPDIGIHPIQVAPSAHGWSPPRGEDGEVWQLSKRTRLVLRVPIHREHDVEALTDKVLNVEPEPVEVGESRIRRLTPADPLFSRQVISRRSISEPFASWRILSRTSRCLPESRCRMSKPHRFCCRWDA